jgi:hypothetical protein
VNFIFGKFFRRAILSLLTVGSILFYWFLSPTLFDRTIISIVGVLAITFILLEVAPLYILIVLSFFTSYSLYELLFSFNTPDWLTMILFVLIFGYLFGYTEQRIGMINRDRPLYFVLYTLIVLETFLGLSYFLINPLNQSLIITLVSYLYVGFCYTVIAKRNREFTMYIVFAALLLVAILFLSSWGSLN